MAEFHFVEDYERHVSEMVRLHGLDEGMSMAVGGSYERIGTIEAEILEYLGLRNGMTLADVGCGSGRTAAALARRLNIEYDGFDIVQSLLDYAKTKSPKNYRFFLNRDIKLPKDTRSYDVICAFSLFTHLLHEETYIYLTDMFRVLKPGGQVVFSFLEFGCPGHWPVFEATVNAAEQSKRPHLNVFIERNVVERMASKIGFVSSTFFDATASIGASGPLGQTVVALRKGAQPATGPA